MNNGNGTSSISEILSRLARRRFQLRSFDGLSNGNFCAMFSDGLQAEVSPVVAKFFNKERKTPIKLLNDSDIWENGKGYYIVQGEHWDIKVPADLCEYPDDAFEIITYCRTQINEGNFEFAHH